MTEDSKSAWRYRPAWMCDEALRLTGLAMTTSPAGSATLAKNLGAQGCVQLYDDEAGQVGEEGMRFLQS